jgi:phosphoglycerate dehydrogenase-like enzyme
MPATQDQPKPRIALLLAPEMRAKIFDAAAEKALAELGDIVAPAAGELTAENMQHLIEGSRAILTGWGTPPLTPDLLAANNSLAFVGHSAGSIHRLVPADAIESGRLRVSHSARNIAEAVAEFVLAQILVYLREPHLHDAGLKAGGEWWDLRNKHEGRLLGNQTVGIVGAGYVGRLVIRLIQAFGARILVVDPFLTAEGAQKMGVERAELDEVFATADIVSLHAPVLPETRHMVAAPQFALLRHGALFVNSARSALVDEAALIAALQEERFTAALDVFDTEPLPLDSPFRKLNNVLIAPHTAGHSIDTHFRQGTTIVGEITRFLTNQPLQHEVTPAMLKTMA